MRLALEHAQDAALLLRPRAPVDVKVAEITRERAGQRPGLFAMPAKRPVGIRRAGDDLQELIPRFEAVLLVDGRDGGRHRLIIFPSFASSTLSRRRGSTETRLAH